jgi:hypothetical protein
VTSSTEAALQALHTTLSAVMPLDVERNREDPIDLDAPVLVMRDGDVEDADDPTLGPPECALHPKRVEVEMLFFAAHRAVGELERQIDVLKQLAVQAVETDTTLGGAVDYAYVLPARRDRRREFGVETLAAAVIPVVLEYCASRASG